MAAEVTETTDKKVEVPERVYLSRFWQSYIEHNCQFRLEQKFEDDVMYVRSDTPNTRQRAERAATKIIESRLDLGLCKLLDGTITDEMRFSKLADIIAAEFEK